MSPSPLITMVLRLFLAFALVFAPLIPPFSASAADPLYEIELTTATQGFDGKQCWVHARAGVIPAQAPGNPSTAPLAVMTLQQLQLTGSDVFYGINDMLSSDLGKTWSAPRRHESFARRPFTWNDLDGLEIVVSDFWPTWHAASEKLLGIGHTVVYQNNRVMKVRPRTVAYATYDPAHESWTAWKSVELPDEPKFINAGAGCAQRVDLEDGTILLPIYFKPPESAILSSTVLRCSFDGTTLRYLSHGSELSLPSGRGLYEPSLARHDGRFYLTLRNDQHGYVSVSEDGQNFSEPEIWRFDDGEDLGNYNTQQHWVEHPKALFLVYTRRGANNDHIPRHRAPLFIARVDPDTRRIIRESEQILVPERGARLGNFGVTEFSPDETWVTAAEWMQTSGPNYHDPSSILARGADNRVWIAKLKWKP